MAWPGRTVNHLLGIRNPSFSTFGWRGGPGSGSGAPPPASSGTYDLLFPGRPTPGSLDSGVSGSWTTIMDIRWGLQGLNGGEGASSYTAVPFSATENGSNMRNFGDDSGATWGNLLSLQSMSTITGGNGTVLACRIPTGFPGGASPARIFGSASAITGPAWGFSYSSQSGPIRSTYVAAWVLLSSGFSTHGNRGYKGIQVGQNPGTGTLAPNHFMHNYDNSVATTVNKLCLTVLPQAPFSATWFSGSASNVTLNDGTWHLCEAYTIAPSQFTQSTGTVLVRVDGGTWLSGTTYDQFESDQSGYLNTWSIQWLTGGGSNPVPSTQTWYFGPILIMGAR